MVLTTCPLHGDTSTADTKMRSTPKPPHTLALFHGIAAFVFFAIQGSVCFGQLQREPENARQNRIRIENQIQSEAVQRTSDILSMSTITSNLDTRISRLERRLLSASPYAGISVKEAQAALKLAMAERHDVLKRPSKSSEVEIAAAELSVARAESQLTVTLATQRETMLLCQLDVIEAELSLLQMNKKVELQQRLIARGLGTSETFRQQKLAVNAAVKKLELMRVRQETQRILQGVPNAKPEGDAKQTAPSSTKP